MKILTIKPGTKIRTKQYKREWGDRLNMEGFVVGSGRQTGWIRIEVTGYRFDVHPKEIEVIKLPKKFNAWK